VCVQKSRAEILYGFCTQHDAPVFNEMDLVGAVGIELLFNFTKSRVFTVLPTANQMNWSQMELSFASPTRLTHARERCEGLRHQYLIREKLGGPRS